MTKATESATLGGGQPESSRGITLSKCQPPRAVKACSEEPGLGTDTLRI